MKTFLSVFLLFGFMMSAFAQDQSSSLLEMQKVINETLLSKWYERIQLKGYAHFRYNRSFESNSKFVSSSSDRSIGNNKGFFLRRARFTFYGDISDRVYVYVQPDYSQDAGAGGTPQNYLQIRDAYFDYALTEKKDFRIRSGISKVPFGFVNLQSSSNRAPLDRDDALNTAAPNERDTGVTFMYAPVEIRKRFKELTSNNLKGSGDHGVFALGAYNGQTLNRPEENNDLHRVVRLTYPFKLNNGQFIEASIQAYEGKVVVANGDNFYEQRSAASLIFYPQPFGFQMEYNQGVGPEFKKSKNKIVTDRLEGGYAQLNYQAFYKNHRFFPFIRYQRYEGGRKVDNGNRMLTKEWEFGTEWQPNSALEITAAYAVAERIVESISTTQNLNQRGQLLRLQAQFNY